MQICQNHHDTTPTNVYLILSSGSISDSLDQGFPNESLILTLLSPSGASLLASHALNMFTCMVDLTRYLLLHKEKSEQTAKTCRQI